MNDPLLAIGKLKELLDQARTAETDLERSTIYSAARWLIADLDAENEEGRYHFGEHIENARWAFGAMLGFDITNGHPLGTHWGWGRQALKVLEEGFARLER